MGYFVRGFVLCEKLQNNKIIYCLKKYFQKPSPEYSELSAIGAMLGIMFFSTLKSAKL